MSEAQSSVSAKNPIPDQIDHNIESVAALRRREWATISPFQRRLESVSRLISRPAYITTLVILIGLWAALNIAARWVHHEPWDPPPFELLDCVMTFLSLITSTIVLIAQHRQTKLEQQHTQLDLQVNLLTEQKVTKLIHLIEELRRDIPIVKDRHDPLSSALQERTDTLQVLAAIEERGLTNDEAVEPRPPQD
jgi:uncharacterized membrane protein